MKLQISMLALSATALMTGLTTAWTTVAHSDEIWTSKPFQSTPAVGVNVQELNGAFTKLAQDLSPAVVSVFSTSKTAPPTSEDDLERFFGSSLGSMPGMRPREARGMGTGFVINKEGYIVTNAHVVRSFGKNADDVRVEFLGEEGSKGHTATVVGVDEVTDVALLKLKSPKSDLKTISLGDSDSSKVGEMVIAIGNPYGHSHTVTQGVVSAKGRSVEGLQADFIQTSASINPGNSGGPLINMAGEVIGINTAIDPRAQGIGFAVPINSAKSVIKQLVTNGEVTRPWLGLAIQDLTEEIKVHLSENDQSGVLVGDVMPQSPAASAGLKTYDIVKRFNGKKVENTKQLLSAIRDTAIGKSADVEVLRNQKLQSFKIKVGKRPTEST